MMMPVETRDRLNPADLMVALVALLFLLIARPVLAQTSFAPPASNTATTAAPSTTTGTTMPGGSINPSMTATPIPQNSTTQSTYLNPPGATPVPGSSQSQRDANAAGRNGLNQQLQRMPECRADDAGCIEQRNRMNQTNPQTAPTFNR